MSADWRRLVLYVVAPFILAATTSCGEATSPTGPKHAASSQPGPKHAASSQPGAASRLKQCLTITEANVAAALVGVSDSPPVVVVAGPVDSSGTTPVKRYGLDGGRQAEWNLSCEVQSFKTPNGTAGGGCLIAVTKDVGQRGLAPCLTATTAEGKPLWRHVVESGHVYAVAFSYDDQRPAGALVACQENGIRRLKSMAMDGRLEWSVDGHANWGLCSNPCVSRRYVLCTDYGVVQLLDAHGAAYFETPFPRNGKNSISEACLVVDGSTRFLAVLYKAAVHDLAEVALLDEALREVWRIPLGSQAYSILAVGGCTGAPQSLLACDMSGSVWLIDLAGTVLDQQQFETEGRTFAPQAWWDGDHVDRGYLLVRSKARVIVVECALR